MIERHAELADQLEEAYEEHGPLIEGEAIDKSTWIVEVVAEDPDHDLYEEAVELLALEELISDAEGYGDWEHGATLIREDKFVDYAQQLAEDIGAIDRNAGWPSCYIDWGAAADALKVDYVEVEFDGNTYLMRV